MSELSSSQIEVSFESFSFKNPVKKALQKQKLEVCTPVQAQGIPHVLAGADLLANAETGSGKTAAYLLPLIQRMLTEPAPRSGTRALVLAPTRELARQIHKHFEALAEFTPLQATVIAGGQELKYQKALLRKNPEVVIATPGRLLEHLSHNSADLQDLEFLVLDEADRMLDMGFSEDVLKIALSSREERQTLLFSATLNHRRVDEVASQILKSPINLTIDRVQEGHENIDQQIIHIDDAKHKERLLTWLLANEKFKQLIIFANTRAKVKSLTEFLASHNVRVAQLHGEITQDERNAMLTQMRQGHVNVLVATDVAARGIDIKAVDLVVNFDMPQSGEDYVHRIGRTGRAGEKGVAISFVGSHDAKLLDAVENYLSTTVPVRIIKGHEANYAGESRTRNDAYKSFKKSTKDNPGKKSPYKKSSVKPKPEKKRESAGWGDGWAPLVKKKKDRDSDT